jgi:hypothetical protein
MDAQRRDDTVNVLLAAVFLLVISTRGMLVGAGIGAGGAKFDTTRGF